MYFECFDFWGGGGGGSLVGGGDGGCWFVAVAMLMWCSADAMICVACAVVHEQISCTRRAPSRGALTRPAITVSRIAGVKPCQSGSCGDRLGA